MTPTAEAHERKPRLAFIVATSLGLGYLPKAPGTWGSLCGFALGWCAVVSSRWWAYAHVGGTGPDVTARWAADFTWMDWLLRALFRPTGNIWSRDLYFFEYAIFGNHIRPGRRSPSMAG